MRQHLLVEESELLDLASRAYQEALAFGVNEHAFERLARSVEYKCQDGTTVAGLAVLAERKRQVEAEGWTAEHDDQCGSLELVDAATCYALAPPWLDIWDDEKQAMKKWQPTCPPAWPWALSWWKPRSRRENLVRAGALILAEIERIDRSMATREAP
ncbi:hypothetical protein M6G63_14500 [Pseudomonas sp. BYT-5]|uniref:hypothetical protein n=1 Tax=unclassified Pseudomonas TaxID=196821 RepID=UPI00202062EA|nr:MULTISPECIES: hypothetical protein [unclassified Pseudomonas]URD40692.1 hypothetical protein M6G63_14500 [Pseudomonas sp. BYT-5]URK96051.1 hypothetical protein J5X93_15190 [Pseudomonas sp. BYT-1]